ncbi:hypothetical protein DSECCO2_559050 [anaerobic digester metagenome]
MVPLIHFGDAGMVPIQWDSAFDHIGIEICVGEVEVFTGTVGVGHSIAHSYIHSAHSGYRRGSDLSGRPDELVIAGGITNAGSYCVGTVGNDLQFVEQSGCT